MTSRTGENDPSLIIRKARGRTKHQSRWGNINAVSPWYSLCTSTFLNLELFLSVRNIGEFRSRSNHSSIFDTEYESLAMTTFSFPYLMQKCRTSHFFAGEHIWPYKFLFRSLIIIHWEPFENFVSFWLVSWQPTPVECRMYTSSAQWSEHFWGLRCYSSSGFSPVRLCWKDGGVDMNVHADVE